MGIRRSDTNMLATMEFRLNLEQNGIRHTDCRHAQRVNFWRHILPPELCEAIAREPLVGKVGFELKQGALLPAFKESNIARVPLDSVEKRRIAGIEITPRLGRFYPRCIMNGVPGVFWENVQPFRCLSLDEGILTADLNHPLAGRQPDIGVWLHDLRPKFEEHGGTTVDWLELAAEGPGMQARAGNTPTDFFSDDPFAARMKPMTVISTKGRDWYSTSTPLRGP